MFDLHAFTLAPTEEALFLITRDDLVTVAGHYKLQVSGSPSKAELQEGLINHLRDRGVFVKRPVDEPTSPTRGNVQPLSPSEVSLALKRLQLREMELEWEREKNIRDREHELRLKELEFNQALRLKEMDLKAREADIHFNVRVPIKILRDTGASQSFILENVLPFCDKTSTGCSVLVRGFEMGFVNVPLHEISLQSDLVTDTITVGIRPSLPIANVVMLLGNDVCGGKVLPGPIVSHVSPKTLTRDDLSVNFPEVFASSVVTRAMARDVKATSIQEQRDAIIDLSDSFMARPSLIPDSVVPQTAESLSSHAAVPKLSVDRDLLSKEQRNDPSLATLFSEVMSDEDIEQSPHGYFLRDGVLMRKWRPLTASAQDEWRVLYQIVIPASFRDEVLSLAHDHHFAGHLAVNKTTDRILRHFFWPGLKRDVVRYCKTCHPCQITGKPNQVIPPAPLQPIPVSSEPFEHVILDCVGQLPKTKSGNQWLLTIMCSLTRFPEAIPLRRITAPVIIKALLCFFSLFGLPKTVQTDRGTNFMSHVFAEAMRQLSVKHVKSSAYHPQSQGALERFHLTLKNILKTFCLEFERDWDEGVPLALFAVREVVQESLGFSPAELVFGHTVRGPLKLLKESWLSETKTYRGSL
ncbi:Retrovirus-related Pol polyprotein from transposon 412 [Merluccius polli]|uniref:Gypsy retrotransposon integrase-like protein 1 n=1 Tax=Merluccius polli TaxID=89951 RepID=A0AA47MMT2_MERPO|nr:Retrovirus-related Pol polyprotein from transposon 412 [Merluccius polli]